MKKGFKTRLLSFVLIALMALQVLPLGIMSFATEGEPAAQATYTDADYNAIYVQKDLTYAWDAFDITESFNGKMVSWTDGTTTVSGSNYFWNGEYLERGLASGAFITHSVIDFTSILPKHIDEATGLVVCDDMTFEMVLSHQLEIGAGNDSTNYRSTLIIAPAEPGNVVNNYVAGTAGKMPIDATYGPVTQSQPGYYCNDAKTGTTRYTYDYGGWSGYGNDHLFGAPAYDIFTVGFRHKYTMATATTGTVTASYFRDAKQPVYASWVNYDLVAPYDAQYIGCNTPATADNLVLKFGGTQYGHVKYGYHAIRMYNRAISETEMQQNHMADLFKYYGVDLSLYYACDSTEKAAVRTALSTVQLGKSSTAEIEGVLKANNTLTYNDLYVQNGLTFAWDAFDITASFNPAKDAISWVDGTTVANLGSNYAWGSMNAPDGKAWKYYGEANKCFVAIAVQDFTNLLPMHTDEESGLTVLDDMTFEMVLSNLYPNGGGGPGSANYTGQVVIAPASEGMLQAYNTASQPSQHPIDETYGPISMFMPGYYTPMDPASTDRNALFFDMGDWGSKNGNHFLGAPMGDIYSVAISHDFTMATATTGTLKASFWRDARPAIDNSWGGSKSSLDARYDARYVGNFNESQSGGWNPAGAEATADNLVLKFGGGQYGSMRTGYHAIRMYDRALNEAELQQNHMADLFKYYEVDLDIYTLMSAEDKANLAATLQPIALGETSKDEIELMAKAEIYDLKEGYLEAAGLLSFDGYQVRTSQYAGLRSRFTVNFDAALANGATLVEVGAVAGIAEKGELSVVKTADGYKGVNGVATTIWKDGALAVEDEKIFTAEDEKLHFAYTVTFEGASGNKTNYETELQFLAYAVIEVEGTEFVVYADMTSQTFGDTVSMLEVSQYADFQKYSTSQAVIAACAAE